MIVALILLMFVLSTIVAYFVHEAGHWLTARALGYPASIVVTRRGPGTSWGSDSVAPTRLDRVLVSASGAAANVLYAAAAFAAGVPALALVSLFVGLVQLVPFGPTDGARMLAAIR